MVATSPIAGIRYRNNAAVDSPSVSAATTDMVQDLDLVTTPHFPSGTERNAAYAAAIAGTGVYQVGGVNTPRLGMICTVGTPPDPVVAYMWNGTAWTPDLARRVAYDATKSFSNLLGSQDTALSFQSDGTGRYTTNAGGVTVGEGGVYAATLCMIASAPISDTKVGYGYIIGNGAESRGYIPEGQQKGSATLSGMILAPGNLIAIGFGHTNAASLGLACRLSITKLSA